MERLAPALESAATGPYVRHVTAAPIRGRSRPCQGLHNATFLPYGSCHVERSAAASSIKRFEDGFEPVAALPGG